MQTIELLEQRKKAYLGHLAMGMPESMCRRSVKATRAEVIEWRQDPDFALEEGRSKEDAATAKREKLEEVQYEAVQALSAGLADDPQLALQVLGKIDDRFNPAQKHEIEAPKHHFIGFDGNDLHEETDGEESDKPEESSTG